MLPQHVQEILAAVCTPGDYFQADMVRDAAAGGHDVHLSNDVLQAYIQLVCLVDIRYLHIKCTLIALLGGALEMNQNCEGDDDCRRGYDRPSLPYCDGLVTDDPEGLKSAIIHQLHHSATQIQATGAYSGAEKTVLLCIVNSSQVNELAKLVTQFPDSFVIVSSVSSVVGNFKRLDSHGKPQVTFYDGGIPKQGN